MLQIFSFRIWDKAIYHKGVNLEGSTHDHTQAIQISNQASINECVFDDHDDDYDDCDDHDGSTLESHSYLGTAKADRHTKSESHRTARISHLSFTRREFPYCRKF